MSGGVIMQQAAIGEVCASMPKSPLCGALAPSIGGFNRALLEGSANCRCSRQLKARSWPRNRRNPANVGFTVFLVSMAPSSQESEPPENPGRFTCLVEHDLSLPDPFRVTILDSKPPGI